MEVRGGAMGPLDEPLVAVFAPGAQRTRSLSLDTMVRGPWGTLDDHAKGAMVPPGLPISELWVPWGG